MDFACKLGLMTGIIPLSRLGSFVGSLIEQVPDLIDLRRPLEGDFWGFEFGHFARCAKITNFLSSGELRSRLRTSGEITNLL